MKTIDTAIPDVKVIEPQIFEDERGFFFESYHQKKFNDAIGRIIHFVQDNHSKSTKNTLRGLHYQLDPFAQGKLVRVVKGEIYDVAVDIRRSSPYFGQWVGVHISAENKRQLWIPEGFAHGFLTLSDSAEVMYKATNFYAPSYEHSLLWKDEDIGIQWPKSASPLLSPKDAGALMLTETPLFS